MKSLRKIEKIASANLPTSFGHGIVHIYKENGDDTEHAVLQFGELKNGCLVRVHSECFTGEVLRSTKCDCADQLDESLEKISESGGLLIYLRNHEGRGIGLGNKIRAYSLQDSGLDTIDANHELGFSTDERNFEAAAAILNSLKISKVRLITNNPEKLKGLTLAGIEVIERVTTRSLPTQFNRDYLQVKIDKMGHYLSPRKLFTEKESNTFTMNATK